MTARKDLQLAAVAEWISNALLRRVMQVRVLSAVFEVELPALNSLN